MSKSNEKTIRVIFLVSIPILLILGSWTIFKTAFYGNARKATEAEAKYFLSLIIKYQKEYKSTNIQFANDSLEKLGLASSKNRYQYSVIVNENKVVIFAKLKSKNSSNPEDFIKGVILPDMVGDAKSFVAGMFVFSANSNSQADLKEIFCVSKIPKSNDLDPPFLQNGVPICSANTKPYE